MRCSATADDERDDVPDTDWRGRDLRDYEFGRAGYFGIDFRGCDMRCARTAYAGFTQCRFDGADLRLAHIKHGSDLFRRHAQLLEQNARLLSRKALSIELLDIACRRLHDLQELAAALTEKRWRRPGWLSRCSVLSATIAAAAEPGDNPIARDLIYEVRRVARLPLLLETRAPFLVLRGVTSYGD